MVQHTAALNHPNGRICLIRRMFGRVGALATLAL